MAYLFNEEDLDLYETVKDFCENEIKEQCKEYDDKLKAELKAYRKALKQKKCYERHLKNLEKKKRR